MVSKIIIDPGHGSDTPGKRMRRDDGSFFFEYQSNREIASILSALLEEAGIDYCWTVGDGEKDVPLKERCARANRIAREAGVKDCLFVSVHSNACGDGSRWQDRARGWEVYTSKGRTASDGYAEIFYEEAVKLLTDMNITMRTDMSDGDHDKEADFYVLKHTACPAVLIEGLFYTSHQDLAILDSGEGKELLARVMFNAIRRIVGA